MSLSLPSNFGRLRPPAPLPSLVRLTFLVSLALYLAVVGLAAVAIYHLHRQNGLTRLAEAVFPYPAAYVDHQPISLRRFRKEVNARLYYAHQHNLPASQAATEHQVADQLANRTLYAADLKRRGITISDLDVQNRLDAIYKEVGGQDKLAAFLQENYGPGIGLDDFKVWVRELLDEAALQDQLLVHVQVSHILVALPDSPTDAQVAEARQKAVDIKAKISDPAQFASVAKQYSEDVASRDKGGALGSTLRGEASQRFSPEFENALFSLPVGQVSDPVRSRYGWHLLLVTKREGSIDASLATYTSDLRSTNQTRLLVGN